MGGPPVRGRRWAQSRTPGQAIDPLISVWEYEFVGGGEGAAGGEV